MQGGNTGPGDIPSSKLCVGFARRVKFRRVAHLCRGHAALSRRQRMRVGGGSDLGRQRCFAGQGHGLAREEGRAMHIEDGAIECQQDRQVRIRPVVHPAHNTLPPHQKLARRKSRCGHRASETHDPERGTYRSCSSEKTRLPCSEAASRHSRRHAVSPRSASIGDSRRCIAVFLQLPMSLDGVCPTTFEGGTFC
jgi:hypothetical protein